MRLLLQKVSSASVTVEGKTVGEIGRGYLLFVCVMRGDGAAEARTAAEKIVKLRLFEGEDGKINDRSLLDVGGSALVVSQFTLSGKTEKGNRPDYTGAAPAGEAEALYKEFLGLLGQLGVGDVQAGTFGAHMDVHLTNDGPVTLLIEV